MIDMDVTAHLERNIAALQAELAMLEAGEVQHFRRDSNGGWRDASADEAGRCRRNIHVYQARLKRMRVRSV